MAKRKGRAARKQQRVNASVAAEHGLPAPALDPAPARTRKVGGDVVALAIQSEKEGRSPAFSSRSTPVRKGGFSMLAKVATGAALVLAVVYGLSQLRKESAGLDTADRAGSDRSLAEETAHTEPVLGAPTTAESPLATKPAPAEDAIDQAADDAAVLEAALAAEASGPAAETAPSPPPPVVRPTPSAPAPAPVVAAPATPAPSLAPTPAPAAPASPAPVPVISPTSAPSPAAPAPQ